jgi:membrane peptidoglycan carboxypeptidase
MACAPQVIQSAKTVDGTSIAGLGPRCQQVVAPAVADTVTSVLQSTFGATGTASGLDLGDRPAAGKTGTTNNSGATWFAGYTPQLATSVWVGDPRGPSYSLHDVEAYGQTFSNVYGRSIAGPIWRQTMTDLSAKLPVETFPVADPAALVGSAPSLPDVRGQARDVAIAVLRRAGYRVVIAPQTALADSLYKPGYVSTQSPQPNSPVAANAIVTLTLTAGSQTAVVIPGQTTP